MEVTSLVRFSGLYGGCQKMYLREKSGLKGWLGMCQASSWTFIAKAWFLAPIQQCALGVVVRQHNKGLKGFSGKGYKSPALGSQAPSSVTSPPPPIKHRLEKAVCVQCQGGCEEADLFRSCNLGFPAESVYHTTFCLFCFLFHFLYSCSDLFTCDSCRCEEFI